VRIPLALLLNLDLPKRGPGYLDLPHVADALPRAITATVKDIELYEDDRRLLPSRSKARISLPSDRSFETFQAARAHIEGPGLRDTEDVFWNQGYFDAHIEYAIGSERGDFALHLRIAPGLRDRLKMTVHFLPPDGTARVYQLSGGADRLVLDPRWFHAAGLFVKSGFLHILEGADHLLFLVCLIIPFRRLNWALVWVVTSFTVAHSITLVAGAYGLMPSGAWFLPLVEVLIAASILYMAIENVVTPNLRRRWFVAGVFGLVHGFAFSILFRDQLQLAGSHLLLSILAFNVGIELGQLLVLAVALLAFTALFRRRPAAERVGTILVSIVAGHAAWHWLVDRTELLRKVQWPSAAGISRDDLLPWALLAGGTLACAWLVWGRWRAKRALPSGNAAGQLKAGKPSTG
jgi:hypothetical protein